MLSSLKGKRIYSILNKKGPVCHEGDYFINNNIYNLKSLGKNHVNCSKCGHKFEKEVGFFQGAMFVSYALTVAFSVAIGVAVLVLFPSSPYYVYIISIIGGLILLMPISYAMSRMIWMNLFAKFKAKPVENIG